MNTPENDTFTSADNKVCEGIKKKLPSSSITHNEMAVKLDKTIKFERKSSIRYGSKKNN